MAKILLTIKDTDIMHDAVSAHVDEELGNSDLPIDEQEAIKDLRYDKYINILDNWFKFGEYITLEFDTEEKTARVLTRDEHKSDKCEFEYLVFYSYKQKSLQVDYWNSRCYAVFPCYPSREAAEQAIKELEAEYKLVFGVE